MPKNILIFSDGTGQAGGLKPDQSLSNVYKLYRATRVNPDNTIDPREQVAFYDAGLGTEEDGGSIPLRIVRGFRKSISGATGTGISRNIADCYEAIVKHYEPGDRIHLFGFSRGAYTARCVGGVLGLCGIPTRGADGGPLPRFGKELRRIADEAVADVYEHGSGKGEEVYAAERTVKAKRFRKKYESEIDGQANAVPYFIGVFDTVAALGSAGAARVLVLAGHILLVALLAAAVGLFLDVFLGLSFLASAAAVVAVGLVVALGIHLKLNLKVMRDFPLQGDFNWHVVSWRLKFYNKQLNKRVNYARHALAIDEERLNFARVPWEVDGESVTYPEGEPEWMKQIWFAGNHSDIGGSYPEDESRLSDVALEWMTQEAKSLPHPILVDDTKLRLYPYALGLQHSEVLSMGEKYPGWLPRKMSKRGLKAPWRDRVEMSRIA